MAFIKTGSFAVIHFTIAFSIVYLLTGDAFIGGTIALIEPACNTIAFFFHEKLWTRLSQSNNALPFRRVIKPA